MSAPWIGEQKKAAFANDLTPPIQGCERREGLFGASLKLTRGSFTIGGSVRARRAWHPDMASPVAARSNRPRVPCAATHVVRLPPLSSAPPFIIHESSFPLV